MTDSNSMIFCKCPKCGSDDGYVICDNCDKFDMFSLKNNLAECDCGEKIEEIECDCGSTIYGKHFFINKEKESKLNKNDLEKEHAEQKEEEEEEEEEEDEKSGSKWKSIFVICLVLWLTYKGCSTLFGLSTEINTIVKDNVPEIHVVITNGHLIQDSAYAVIEEINETIFDLAKDKNYASIDTIRILFFYNKNSFTDMKGNESKENKLKGSAQASLGFARTFAKDTAYVTAPTIHGLMYEKLKSFDSIPLLDYKEGLGPNH